MAQILYGKPVAQEIRQETAAAASEHRKAGRSPGLAIVRLGERNDDLAYEQRVLKNCGEAGIEAVVHAMPQTAETPEVIDLLEDLNHREEVNGILVFRPLPSQVDEDAVSKKISWKKDIDCMSPENLSKVFFGDERGFAPCTPEAVVAILKHYEIDLTGKNVVIVNRSLVLGKPLSMLFLKENATVTLCHSKTKDLPGLTAAADIVVTGIGKPRFFGAEYFSSHSVVIDVGINFEDGKMCGDVNFEEASKIVQAITPVPGGVGGVTSAILISHVIKGMRL